MSRKVTIIGAGNVGATIAYTLSLGTIASEIVLIDINKEKVEGEVMDIVQGASFREPISVVAGDYEDARDSHIVIITSGVGRKPGQTRIELAQTNVNILKQITPQIVAVAPNALYVIVSNPVDIMTYVFTKISGLPENQIIGSGTVLDTARLKYELAEHLEVDSRSIHAFIVGEHGDSEFVPWSQALLSTKRVIDICNEDNQYSIDELEKISEQVRTSAYTIIKAKNATYYGIGMSMVRLTKAILGNENSVLTVSAKLTGEYGQNGVYVGIPCIIGRNGIGKILEIDLTEEEKEKFLASCKTLSDSYNEIIN